MEGRIMLGLVLDAQALGIDEPGIDELFAEYAKHFKKDGYFGPIYFPDHVDEQQLSSHGWVLRALLNVYHLLDPAYDQTGGSCRQMVFPYE